jgi:ABC-2 type transport system ATP-binding protein
VDESIESCLLESVAGRKVENLSRGFRQRTALAGALVHQPPVLILDEPTVGLDPAQIIRIREAIRRLGRERAVLLSTHILPEVDAVCDRVLIIDRGRIVAEGTASDLRAKLAGAPMVRVAFKGTVPVEDALRGLTGVTSIDVEGEPGETRARLTCMPESDPREDVYRVAVERGWVLRELTLESVSLEDVFVRLTQHEETAPESAGAAEPSPAATVPAPEETGS